MINRIKHALEVRILSDKKYTQRRFLKKTGKTLNLKSPQSFSEKIQWLKLYYHHPSLPIMADKIRVKDYIAGIIDEKHIIPTHSIYDKASDIKLNELPEQYVLKTNHGSGRNLICKDENCYSEDYIQKHFKKWLGKSYYLHSKEWAYNDIKPKVICEKLIIDEDNNLPKDYKFFCFDGKVKYIQVDHNRFTNHTRSIYDKDWNKLNFSIEEPMHKETIEMPKNFSEMKLIAEKLSSGIPFVRIDLYNIDGSIYFGEITFYPGGGVQIFSDYSWDLKFGNLINLPKSK